MPARGAFDGKRLDFLLKQQDRFAEGVEEGIARDVAMDIIREYFLVFSIDMPITEEPTDEFIAAVDFSVAAPEMVVPDLEGMTLEDFEAQMELWEDRQHQIQLRKAVSHMNTLQPHLLLTICVVPSANQAMASLSLFQGKNPSCLLRSPQMLTMNPPQVHASSKPSEFLAAYASLWATLTGQRVNKPRKYSAKNRYKKTVTDELERRTDEAVAKDKTGSKRLPLWQKQLDHMWKILPKVEKAKWEAESVAEFEEAKVVWKARLDAPVSTKPEDRQQCVFFGHVRYAIDSHKFSCIESLSAFVHPILEGICERTGLKGVLILGGPEPAWGGRLNAFRCAYFCTLFCCHLVCPTL